MTDDPYARTFFTRELRCFPAQGVPKAEMEFCGEPTADGDAAAGYVRTWYERNREGWYDRWQRQWEWAADEFILWFMQEVDRVNAERVRQTAARQKP
jgi:hypothetical protein